MIRPLLAAVAFAALAGARPAAAQVYSVPTPYCGGNLIAEQFETRVTPGAQGRSEYFMRVFNPRPQTARFQVQVVGDLLGKPTGQQSVNANGRTTIALGYTVAGRQPLRNEQLANAVRVSCF
ncbi:MAG: hypothetical protein K2X11_08535 [Acetobacteraceae bacterium]|nr:hypothetical protein [Acetobacteraceae bacterium]